MTSSEKINTILISAKLHCNNFILEAESQDYDSCCFEINGIQIHYRKAKITPKKEGQFVTFWKRIPSGIIAPFEDNDNFDFLIVAVENEIESGWFIFPKSILVSKKIVSTSLVEGKRAFRIYPPSSVPKSKQAMASQKWQNAYFIKNKELPNILAKKLNLEQ